MSLVGRVEGVSGRVRFAKVVLGVNFFVNGVGALVAGWQILLFAGGAGAVGPEAAQANLDRFVAVETASWIAFLVGVLGFVRWLRATYKVAIHVVARPLELTPSGAVMAFFIPVVSLYRPYQALRDLDAKIDPSQIAEPPIRPASGDVASGYREAATETHPARADLPPAPVRAWWLAWIGAAVVSIASALGRGSLSFTLWTALGYRVVEACAAALALVMVTRIHARLVERARRMAAQSGGDAFTNG